MNDDLELDQDLFFEFIAESSDALHSLDELFVQIENNPGDLGVVDQIFRPVHSIKGNSSFFGLINVKNFSHSFESLLQEIRSGKRSVTPEIIDVFLAGGDCLKDMIVRAEPNEKSSDLTEHEQEVLERIESFLNDKADDPAVKLIMAKKELVALIKSEPGEAVGGKLKEIDLLLDDVANYFAADSTMIEGSQYYLGEENITDFIQLISEFVDNVIELSLEKEKSDNFLTAVTELIRVASKLNFTTMVTNLEALKNDYLTISEAGIGFDEVMSSLLEERYENIMKSVTLKQSDSVGEVATVEPEKKESSEQKVSEKKSVEELAEKQVKEDKKKTAKGKEGAVGKSIRVEEDKVDSFMSFVGELIIASEVFAYLQQKLEAYPQVRDISQEFKNANISFNELSNNLQKSLMSVRRLPLKTVLQRLPRIIREISSSTGKKVKLEVIGEDTSIDKSLIEGLEDPLVHMVRNSVDHGIELPEVREAAGKDPEGRVTITARSTEEIFTITITDDGAGIDLDNVKQKAIEKGIISEEKARQMSDNEAGKLIFGAGVSTAKKVTEISGRGVGMDVVRTNIEKLGGLINVETQLGKGSVFTISLPMTVTLMVVDGLVAKVGGGSYILPINDVRESVRPGKDDVVIVSGKGEAVNVRGELYKLIRLYDILGVETECCEIKDSTVILVESKYEICGVMVDEVVGQQSVVLKDLGKKFENLQIIKGGAVMGDSSIGLILDTEGVFAYSKK